MAHCPPHSADVRNLLISTGALEVLRGPAGGTGLTGATGATGAPGLAGPGAVIPFSATLPITVGILPPATVGFAGPGALGGPETGTLAPTGPLFPIRFVAPRTGTLTTLAAGTATIPPAPAPVATVSATVYKNG